MSKGRVFQRKPKSFQRPGFEGSMIEFSKKRSNLQEIRIRCRLKPWSFAQEQHKHPITFMWSSETEPYKVVEVLPSHAWYRIRKCVWVWVPTFKGYAYKYHELFALWNFRKILTWSCQSDLLLCSSVGRSQTRFTNAPKHRTGFSHAGMQNKRTRFNLWNCDFWRFKNFMMPMKNSHMEPCLSRKRVWIYGPSEDGTFNTQLGFSLLFFCQPYE